MSLHPFIEAHLCEATGLLRDTLGRAPVEATDRMTMARVYGALVAIQQLVELQDVLADTERPVPVKLTVVR